MIRRIWWWRGWPIVNIAMWTIFAAMDHREIPLAIAVIIVQLVCFRYWPKRDEDPT